MPHPVRGTSEQREQYMYEIFQNFYRDPKNAGRELSVDRANEQQRKKFGAMLRNKKAYQIRRSVKAALNGQALTPAGVITGQRALKREEKQLINSTSPGAAQLIEGTPEQFAWLQQALPALGWRVDHSTEIYAVLVRL
jgi:hypothetical protein